jgi:hypothetical protein
MLHRTLFLATPTTSLGCGTVRIGYLLKLGEQFGKVLGQVPERKLPKPRTGQSVHRWRLLSRRQLAERERYDAASSSHASASHR